MASRKWFGLLLAVLLTLGMLFTGSALGIDDGSEDEDSEEEDGGILCRDDVECVKKCAEATLRGYPCRL